MNAEVDESAEERKGGAAALGKMLLSAGDKALAVVCQVPKALQEAHESFSIKDWVARVVEATGGKVTEEGDEVRALGGRGLGFVGPGACGGAALAAFAGLPSHLQRPRSRPPRQPSISPCASQASPPCPPFTPPPRTPRLPAGARGR